MIKKVTTASGSVYEFEHRPGGMFVRRFGDEALRRDLDWVRCTGFLGMVEVGKNMTMLLEPLGAGDLTVRSTNLVTAIEVES